ncbi:MAG: iron response transcriptional regulator IrrA [Maricaulaceae bacterium]
MVDTLDPRRLRRLLEDSGLRATRQRLAAAAWLFDGASKHVTAEELHAHVGRAASLATIYNTLNAFTRAGLLRQVSTDGGRVFFDTQVEPHHHFYDEATGALIDVPLDAVSIDALPAPPEGRVIAAVDVFIRLTAPVTGKEAAPDDQRGART